MQLDHVLVDDALVVLDIRELRGSGSDHKPVLVDLAVMSRQ
jgi:endonuclease/exonuclease/phosphatase (EEP) superfamily protein YafD